MNTAPLPAPAFADDLTRRIAQGDVAVSVLGQGYVGLSVAAGAAVQGMPTTGIDIDAERIGALADGRNVVPGVDDTLFDDAVQSGRLAFATAADAVAGSQVVLICVPTPVVEHRPDLRAIESACRAVAPHLQPGALVILESTTYPGTTEQVALPLLEAGGLTAGVDFLLAYSPERIDPGNPKYGLRNTPRVVGGLGPADTEAAAAFYRQVVDEVVTVSSCRAAELAKLLENTFRMVNIALVNELAGLCHEQGIDVWEVIRAAASKPFGFMPFYPGPGVGGHCIPLDPTYLAWQSRRDTGRPFRLVEMAQDINAQMPTYVTARVIESLNDAGLTVQGREDPRARRHLQARRRRPARVRRRRGHRQAGRPRRRRPLPRPLRRRARRARPGPARGRAHRRGAHRGRRRAAAHPAPVLRPRRDRGRQPAALRRPQRPRHPRRRPGGDAVSETPSDGCPLDAVTRYRRAEDALWRSSTDDVVLLRPATAAECLRLSGTGGGAVGRAGGRAHPRRAGRPRSPPRRPRPRWRPRWSRCSPR